MRGAPGRSPSRSAGRARCGSMNARVPMAYAASNGSCPGEVVDHIAQTNCTPWNVRVGGGGALRAGSGTVRFR